MVPLGQEMGQDLPGEGELSVLRSVFQGCFLLPVVALSGK